MKHPGHTYGGFVPAISEWGMTISHREGHLGYIFDANLDLVIVKAEINLEEHLGSC
jgi:hypothetical protein